MEKGYLQIYTGDGKGKTTAAVGLALRAAGAGLRVYIGQFVKDMKYHEVQLIEQALPQIVVEQLGRGCFLDRPPNDGDRQAALDGLNHVRRLMESGQYDLMILDEFSIAIVCGLFGTGAHWPVYAPISAGSGGSGNGNEGNPPLLRDPGPAGPRWD